MSGTDDSRKELVIDAAVRLHKSLYPHEDDTLAEWDDAQRAAMDAFIAAVEEYLDMMEAKRATDS